MELNGHYFSHFMDEKEIQNIVSIVAEKINHDHSVHDRTLLVGILQSGFMLMADLIRHLHSDIDVDFVQIADRGNGIKSPGTKVFLKDIDIDIQDRHVIIVEEVVDSGRTLEFLYQRLRTANPLSLKVAALFNKKSEKKADINIDYVGKELEEKFLLGYGMDLEGKYRNLPYIKFLRYPN